MTRPCRGCGRPGVPYGQLACSACLAAMPAGLRAEVAATFTSGPLHAHAAAVDAAQSWIDENRHQLTTSPSGGT